MLPWERSLLISVYSIQVSVCLVVYRYTRVIGIDKLWKKCCMYIYKNEGLMIYGDRVLVIQSIILEIHMYLKKKIFLKTRNGNTFLY
jgi:Na+/alanine symporter